MRYSEGPGSLLGRFKFTTPAGELATLYTLGLIHEPGVGFPPFFAVGPGVSYHRCGLVWVFVLASLWSPRQPFGGTAYGRAPTLHALPRVRLPAPLPALGSFPSLPPFFPRLGAGHGAWHLFWRAGHRALSLRGAPESAPPVPCPPVVFLDPLLTELLFYVSLLSRALWRTPHGETSPGKEI
ncbi:hypothetical protein ES708_08556 [subsurface metagenome]